MKTKFSSVKASSSSLPRLSSLSLSGLADYGERKRTKDAYKSLSTPSQMKQKRLSTSSAAKIRKKAGLKGGGAAGAAY